MSRVINTNGTGKERNTFTRGIVAALRELMKQKEPDAHSYDLVAFIGLSLVAIDANIEQSVKAWEKRDYWVKADRFRMEWSWAGQVGREILIQPWKPEIGQRSLFARLKLVKNYLP